MKGFVIFQVALYMVLPILVVYSGIGSEPEIEGFAVITWSALVIGLVQFISALCLNSRFVVQKRLKMYIEVSITMIVLEFLNFCFITPLGIYFYVFHHLILSAGLITGIFYIRICQKIAWPDKNKTGSP